MPLAAVSPSTSTGSPATFIFLSHFRIPVCASIAYKLPSASWAKTVPPSTAIAFLMELRTGHFHSSSPEFASRAETAPSPFKSSSREATYTFPPAMTGEAKYKFALTLRIQASCGVLAVAAGPYRKEERLTAVSPLLNTALAVMKTRLPLQSAGSLAVPDQFQSVFWESCVSGTTVFPSAVQL